MTRFFPRRQTKPRMSRAAKKEDIRKSLRIGMPTEPGMWDLG